MNTERIRELAEQAFDKANNGTISDIKIPKEFIEKFAALVAAEERNRIWTQSHWTEYERKIVAAEREACAKLCEAQIKSYMSKRYTTDPLGGYRERFASEQCAAAIRARGNE